MFKRLIIGLIFTSAVASSASAQFLTPGSRGKINPTIPLITGCVDSPAAQLALVTGQANYIQCDAFSNAKQVLMDAAGNARGANVTAAHELLVTGSGTAGTAATNVLTVQGIASMTPVQVSQATASSLNAAVVGIGTAGSASGGILTVQGVASMTPLLVTPAANSAVNVAQVNGTTVLVNTGAVGTGAQRIAVGTDTATIAGSAPGTAGSASANVVTVQGIASMTPLLATVSQATAASLNATVVGTGTFATQSAITAGSGSIASGAIASGALAAGSISSGAAVSGAFADGSLVTLGAKADAKSTATDSTAISMMQVQKEISFQAQAIATNTAAPPPLGTSGGWTPTALTAITNSSQTVKASAGQLGYILCDNNNAAWTYLQLFNATSPSVGTNVGFIPLPPGLSGGMTLSVVGLQFSNSIKVAATTTPTGSTAPATNTISCSFGYN